LITSDKRYLPERQRIGASFRGKLKLLNNEYPIYRFNRNNENGVIGIFDLKNYAHLIQLNPTDNEKEAQYLHHQFYIQIIDLNEDGKYRNEILLAAPEWLNAYKDKERYLKTKVVVKTFMREELLLKNKEAGILLRLI
jgi:hypothetical protein